VSTPRLDLKHWHERLGHMNYKYIRQMAKEGVINCSNDDLEDKLCEVTDNNTDPFQTIAHKKPLPGEIIHSDVGGKMAHTSLGGSNFYVNFKDDSTGFRLLYEAQIRCSGKTQNIH